MQVKLETHTVDLDPYHLETLALLRDAQAREVQAERFESPSGSDHHRQGILIFPGMDASTVSHKFVSSRQAAVKSNCCGETVSGFPVYVHANGCAKELFQVSMNRWITDRNPADEPTLARRRHLRERIENQIST